MMMHRSLNRIGLALIAIGALTFGVARLRSSEETVPPPVTPTVIDYGTVPEFSLTSSAGQAVSLNDLRGRVWVADFIFTHCAGTCPAITGNMRRLQDTLPADTRLVSFSVDPARDTPEVLAKYAKEVGADPARWFFLTGSRQALYDLSIKGFKLAVSDTDGTADEPITHATRFALIDKEGKIRKYYDGTDLESVRQLAEDVKKML